jgi:rubrerythrin
MEKKPEPVDVSTAFALEAASAARNRLYSAVLKRKKSAAALAHLLTAIADSEETHTRRILMHMRGKLGEPQKHIEMLTRSKYEAYARQYPQIADRLEKSGSKTAAEAFEQFGEVAKNHYDLLIAVTGGKSATPTDYFVCGVCGYIATGEAPAKCPVCGAVTSKFRLVA